MARNKEKKRNYKEIFRNFLAKLSDEEIAILLKELQKRKKNTPELIEINKKYSETGTIYSLLREAKKYIGTRHKMGGSHPRKGFDCSGFTQYVFRKSGFVLPRSSKQQSKIGRKLNIEKARWGDLLFFSQDGKNISHVGLVTNKKSEPLSMIHASSSKGVTLTNVEQSKYWKKRLLFARRIV